MANLIFGELSTAKTIKGELAHECIIVGELNLPSYVQRSYLMDSDENVIVDSDGVSVIAFEVAI